MAKLKVSIALAIAVADFVASASAQVPAVRSDAPRAVSDTVVDAPTSDPAAPAPAVPVAVPVAPQNDNVPRWVGATPGPDGTHGAMPRYGIPVASGEFRPTEASTPARTYEYRFAVTLDLANVLWRSGGGYRLFSDNDRAWRIALGFNYDLLKLPEHLVLAIEAGYLGEPAHGIEPSSLGGSLTGSLSASTLLLGSSLRWAITPWVAPYGRLGLLASRIAMDFDATATTNGNSSSSGMSWTHHKWTEGGLLGAGVMLNMLPQTRLNAGLLVEGGLWLQRSVAMRLERDLPAGAIATAGARAGTLENTGPYFRLAVVLRF